jgi:hypothetical protein
MGNLPALVDLICRLRTGRRLSGERGAGFARSGRDRPGDLVLDAADAIQLISENPYRLCGPEIAKMTGDAARQPDHPAS